MADVMQINATCVHIEFVKHTVIGHPEFEFCTPVEAFVRKIFQSGAHLVHFALDRLTNSDW